MSAKFKLDDSSNGNRTQLVEKIVNEIKSRGIFDHFRRECLSDIDRRPAFQILQQKVISNVNHFLDQQKWRPDLNKNQLRETLRQNILRSNFFDNGIEKLVNQVVETKKEELFRPKIDELIQKLFGIEDSPLQSTTVPPKDEDNEIKTSFELEVNGADLMDTLPHQVISEPLLDLYQNVTEVEQQRVPELEPEPLPPGEEDILFIKPTETKVAEVIEEKVNIEQEDEETFFNCESFLEEVDEMAEIPDIVEPSNLELNQEKQKIEATSDELVQFVVSNEPVPETITQTVSTTPPPTGLLESNEKQDEKVPEINVVEEPIITDRALAINELVVKPEEKVTDEALPSSQTVVEKDTSSGHDKPSSSSSSSSSHHKSKHHKSSKSTSSSHHKSSSSSSSHHKSRHHKSSHSRHHHSSSKNHHKSSSSSTTSDSHRHRHHHHHHHSRDSNNKKEDPTNRNKIQSNEEEKQRQKLEIIEEMKKKLERSKEKMKLDEEREKKRKLEEKQKKLNEKKQRNRRDTRIDENKAKSKKGSKLLATPAYIDTMTVEKKLDTMPPPQNTFPKIQRVRKPNLKYCSDEFTSEYYLPHENIDNDVLTLKRKRELANQTLIQPAQSHQNCDHGEAIEDIAAAVAEVTAMRSATFNHPPQTQPLISYNMFTQGPNTLFHNQMPQQPQQQQPQLTGMPMLNVSNDGSLQQPFTVITMPTLIPQGMHVQQQPQPAQPTIIPFTVPQMVFSTSEMTPVFQQPIIQQPVMHQSINTIAHQNIHYFPHLQLNQQQQQDQHTLPMMPSVSTLNLHSVATSVISQDLPSSVPQQDLRPEQQPFVGFEEANSAVLENEQSFEGFEDSNSTALENEHHQEEPINDSNQSDSMINDDLPESSTKDASLEVEDKSDEESLQSLRDSLIQKSSKNSSAIKIIEEISLTDSPVKAKEMAKKRGRKRKSPLVECVTAVPKAKRGRPRKKVEIPVVDLEEESENSKGHPENDDNGNSSEDEPLEEIRRKAQKRAKRNVTEDEDGDSDVKQEVEAVQIKEKQTRRVTRSSTASEPEPKKIRRPRKRVNQMKEITPQTNDSDIEIVFNDGDEIDDDNDKDYVNEPSTSGLQPRRYLKRQHYTSDDLYKPRVSYGNTRKVYSKSKNVSQDDDD